MNAHRREQQNGASTSSSSRHRILCARSAAVPMSKINPDHTLHIQRCCVRGFFCKMYRARVGGVEGLLCKIDVVPLDVEGVVWIDFAHGSSSALVHKIRCPSSLSRPTVTDSTPTLNIGYHVTTEFISAHN
jgi:hypothetical protein